MTTTTAAKPNRITMVQALNQALAEEMERDPSIILLGEDVGVDGGVFRVTQGLQAKFGADRVVDTPLAESGIEPFSATGAVVGFDPPHPAARSAAPASAARAGRLRRKIIPPSSPADEKPQAYGTSLARRRPPHQRADEPGE